MKKNQTSYLKKGDIIKIIAGENKGFIGKIQSIFLKQSIVFIEGIAPRIKYSKSTQGLESKKQELEIPIHISNVLLWDKKSNVASRIGKKVVENKRIRYFKKSGNLVEN